MHTPLLAVTVLACAALSVSAEAQTAPVPAPRTETLRLKFTPGETLYYTLVEDTTGTYTEPHSKPQPIKSHLQVLLHQTITDVRNADGAALVTVGVDSMTVTVDGSPAPISEDALTQMKHLAMLIALPNGKLEETQVNPDFNAEEVLTGEDPSHMNPLAALGQLPDTPVKVGDTWKSTAFLGFLGEKLTAVQSLTAWDTKDKHSVAVITQSLTGTCLTPAPAVGHKAVELKISGRIAATRTMRLNVEAGTIDSAVSVAAMTLTLIPRSAKAPTGMLLKVKSELTRTTAPAPT